MYRTTTGSAAKIVAASLTQPGQTLDALKRFLRDLTGDEHPYVEFELVESLDEYFRRAGSLIQPPSELDRQA